MYVPSTTTQPLPQSLVAKMTSHIYVHTVYYSKTINKKAGSQNVESYMITYPPQQHKHKHKCSFPEFPVSHLHIPSITTLP